MAVRGFERLSTLVHPKRTKSAVNQGWSYRDCVGDEAAGLSISSFYSQSYSHSDITRWRRRLVDGEIEHNGLRTRDDLLLAVGDQLIWHRLPWQEPDVPLQFEVIHDDGDLLIVNKPFGLPVMPAGGFLEHTLLRLLEQCWPVDPPRPVHRLGRGTSGLLICAPRGRSRAWLSAALRPLGTTAQVRSTAARRFALKRENYRLCSAGRRHGP